MYLENFVYSYRIPHSQIQQIRRKQQVSLAVERGY